MNLQAPSTVRGVKVSLPKLDIWEYAVADMVQAPFNIPDGAYEVSFDGRKMRLEKTAQRRNSERGQSSKQGHRWTLRLLLNRAVP
jgi:hypothetical protein